MAFPPVDEQMTVLRRGAEEIVPEDELAEKLRTSRETDTPLTVKLGCDPSRPDLHLGHTVVLRKLRQFQDFGHRAVLIVGDFTGMIGDPSGRSKTRPQLTLEETREHGQSYYEQATRVLDPNKTEIRYNSEWLDEMRFSDVIELAAQQTVAQMLKRDDFNERYEAGQPISLHEFLYPLAQARDSVHIEADVELGGTDQRFNLLLARRLQEANDQAAQVCMMLPLLEGTDGSDKMSKSLDNAIGIAEAPEDMYGKTMSVPDDLIYRYVELVTDIPTEQLPKVKQFAESNPRAAKAQLARRIVEMYHGEEAADRAEEHFEQTVVEGGVPDDLPEYTPTPEDGAEVGLLNLMRHADLTDSNSEGRRMIEQGAVTIDEEKVTDTGRYIDVAEEAPFVLQVGKRRFARIRPPENGTDV
ncbi:tyrosyl-tRNA synthetase [Salinibacter ruber]|jgi:tyrosyl-tRNA synthetase|uniref:Tyrosine--tRNA ligase n=2 Tax=Salinibacter ruber TaxID=146919 RepID=SYY_SALRD|nr:tyrosine--tRNA ligase [Salinibacter ruber]Q2S238.1 RecName: Full=Tyrosine--tRNA ligase; AltName: Full=Tyrosyl-tRNA synthetase; Short=TyrRS [Salinibacter ruber DSM 13855]ABC44550.1 tyrosyl-tRNA synthetase [Salinibacter ruber DSM 13855]MBB4060417.1 tyrosyl-tRNA synthetase [Salinibacter ruber]MBB4068040.1 tyrosyl-tRNA synthetase [Salinibacter ruber]MCS3626627.1 tyrosyl-tRNA synthetase [Salinibacter ruber]MCS3634187.1 tyrosyl-tRNA synthetase [Salinibacter ruber]